MSKLTTLTCHESRDDDVLHAQLGQLINPQPWRVEQIRQIENKIFILTLRIAESVRKVSKFTPSCWLLAVPLTTLPDA